MHDEESAEQIPGHVRKSLIMLVLRDFRPAGECPLASRLTRQMTYQGQLGDETTGSELGEEGWQRSMRTTLMAQSLCVPMRSQNLACAHGAAIVNPVISPGVVFVALFNRV